jgi:hypothetical protein
MRVRSWSWTCRRGSYPADVPERDDVAILLHPLRGDVGVGVLELPEVTEQPARRLRRAWNVRKGAASPEYSYHAQETVRAECSEHREDKGHGKLHVRALLGSTRSWDDIL